MCLRGLGEPEGMEMAGKQPLGELDARFSSPGASPTPWQQALKGLSEAEDALVYRVTPTTVFGFGKGKRFSQTRWRLQAK